MFIYLSSQSSPAHALSGNHDSSYQLQCISNQEVFAATEHLILANLRCVPASPSTGASLLYNSDWRSFPYRVNQDKQVSSLTKPAEDPFELIPQELATKYGEIPVVGPRTNSKREHLKLKRHLFQWDTLSHEKPTSIGVANVQTILRFMLHRLDLYPAQGKPIRVAIHVLRHVMFTHAHHCRNVPPEVVAHFSILVPQRAHTISE